MTSMQTINEPFNSNERKLLNIIRHNGEVPRHKIVEQMDITAQAVGQITKRLDQFKLLVHHKAVKVGLGQPPKPISIKANTAFTPALLKKVLLPPILDPVIKCIFPIPFMPKTTLLPA